MGLLGDRRDRKGRGGLGKERDGWMTCQVDDSHGIRGKLMRHKYVRFWSGTDGGFVGLEFVVFKFLFRVIIRNYRSRGAWFVLSRLLLCRNFFCGEKPTTGSSGAAHGMLMAGLVKIWLTLSRKAMDLFQSGAGYAPFENAKVLLCVDI